MTIQFVLVVVGISCIFGVSLGLFARWEVIDALGSAGVFGWLSSICLMYYAVANGPEWHNFNAILGLTSTLALTGIGCFILSALHHHSKMR